jgi:predicted nucleic acid-binding protein
MAGQTVVIDASVAAKWFLEEENWDAAEALQAGQDTLIAPDLLIAEVLNTYWKHVERKSKPRASIQDVIEVLVNSFSKLVPMVELASSAAEVAIELHHPIYDCFYLALAERDQCALVTADERFYGKTRRTRFASSVRKLV